VAVGVLIGDILSVRGHKEALNGQEVIGVGKLCSEKVVVIIGGVGLLGGKDYFDGGSGRVEGSADSIGVQEYMCGRSVKLLDVLRRGLFGGIKDNAIELVGLKGEADGDVTGGPPTSGQGKNVGIGDELGVIPGLAIVMGVVFPEDVAGGAVEDIDLGAIGGDGTGTVAVGGDVCPLGVIAGLAGVGNFLAEEGTRPSTTNAVHTALAVEGDAVVVVGL